MIIDRLNIWHYNKKMNTIGADPEFILVDLNDTPKSAIEIIKKNKYEKIQIEGLNFFYDNVLAECSIKPAKNKIEFIKNIKKSISIFCNLVKPYKITTKSAAHYSNFDLLHKEANKVGCAYEDCAYSLETIDPKEIENFFKKNNLRTAGGHIHLGTFLGKEDISCIMLVRTLDLFLGFTFLLLEKSEGQFERRKIYGSPGRYRQPTYGVEYRTISNFWLSSPLLVELAYDISKFCINFTKQKQYEKFWKIDFDKLNSDEFWNNGGDPTSCHQCVAYDINFFKSLFKMKHSEVKNKGHEIEKLVEKHLPKEIFNKIKNLENKKFDLYKEWSIF